MAICLINITAKDERTTKREMLNKHAHKSELLKRKVVEHKKVVEHGKAAEV